MRVADVNAERSTRHSDVAGQPPAIIKLAIVVTHPVQYFAPLFRELAAITDLTVYYAHRPSPQQQGDGFGVAFEWDTDLTSGYRHIWLRNASSRPGVSSFSGCNTPEVADLFARARPDVVLVSGWHSLTYLQAAYAARRQGIPVIVRGDSQLARGAWTLRGLTKEIAYPVFIRRFDACLSVGERSEEYFRHYRARRIFRAPHFVDNDRFATGAAAAGREKMRAKFGVDPSALVVLFSGKLTPMKRPQDVIEAVARTRSHPVQLLIAGDGELRPQLQDLARARGISVRFLGFMNQTEIPGAYAAADVLVLPSDSRESWGLVVNEAMASGIPAIVSDAVGCGPDMVENGGTGFVYALGGVSALTHRIEQLAADRGLAATMGVSARAHVAQFTAGRTAEAIREAARSVAAAAR